MKAIRWAIIIAVVLVAVVLASWRLSNPLRGTEAQIQEWLFEQVPLRSSVADLRRTIEDKGWRELTDWTGTETEETRTYYPGVPGTTILQVELGGYLGFPWPVDVDSFWGFDQDGQLIAIRVRKMADSF